MTPSSEYIKTRRREYSLYVMQFRAIPAVTDGLKAGGRRVLWTARNGDKYKCATLAGLTMPLHPHAAPEGAIDTLAAPYGNNIPLFTGYGTFGTLINPTAYGASRYTSVRISKFTKDVLFRDIEIIPMINNYDDSIQEPLHFLPLIPVVLLNPTEGIAIGFATNILPRSLDDIIMCQLGYLNGISTITSPMPKFLPINASSSKITETEKGTAYYFEGMLEEKDTSTAIITKLPYGQTHSAIISKLDDLIDQGILLDYVIKSKDVINIELKFKRGYLKTIPQEEILKMLGLSIRHIENMNMLDFAGKTVINNTPLEIIKVFTDWRLKWYITRYERLRDLLQLEIQRYLDIKIAITHNIGSVAQKTRSRSELKELLHEINIINTDYIADLPVYRFTEDEKIKNEERLKQCLKQLDEYKAILASDSKRKKIYITELTQVLMAYQRGDYNK